MKDRFRRVPMSLLLSHVWEGLSSAARHVWLTVAVSPRQTQPGVYDSGLRTLAHETGLNRARLRAAVRELCATEYECNRAFVELSDGCLMAVHVFGWNCSNGEYAFSAYRKVWERWPEALSEFERINYGILERFGIWKRIEEEGLTRPERSSASRGEGGSTPGSTLRSTPGATDGARVVEGPSDRSSGSGSVQGQGQDAVDSAVGSGSALPGMSEESGSGGNGSGSRVSSAMLPVSRPRAPAVPAVESPAERKRRLRREFARITDEQILGFVDLWNQVLGDVLPQAKLMKGKVPSARRRKIAARLREYPLEWWEGVFQTMRDIPFLLGDSPGKWRADIDWLVDKPTNALRIMEGSFRDGRGVSGGMRREMEEFTKAVAGDGEVVDVTPSKGDGT